MRLSFVSFVESPPSLVVSFFRYLKVRHFGCVFPSESPPSLDVSFFSGVRVRHFGCVFPSSLSLKVRHLWLCLSFVLKVRHLGCVFLSESPPILVASFSLSSFRKSTSLGLFFVRVKVRHLGCVFLLESPPHPGCVFLSSYLVCSTHHRLSHNSLAEFIASWHKHKLRLSLPSKKKKRLSSPNWIRSPTLDVSRDFDPAEERYTPNPERN